MRGQRPHPRAIPLVTECNDMPMKMVPWYLLASAALALALTLGGLELIVVVGGGR